MKSEVLAPEVFGCLQQATASDPASLADLCRDYVADARRTLGLLRQDILDQNPEHLWTHAHYLKGSSQVIGAKGVARCCMALEAVAKNGEFTNASKLVDSAADAVAAAETEMATRLGAIAPSCEPAVRRD